jgi:hypothetical protein
MPKAPATIQRAAQTLSHLSSARSFIPNRPALRKGGIKKITGGWPRRLKSVDRQLRHMENEGFSSRGWIPSGHDGLANIRFNCSDGNLRPLRELRSPNPCGLLRKGVFQNEFSMAGIFRFYRDTQAYTTVLATPHRLANQLPLKTASIDDDQALHRTLAPLLLPMHNLTPPVSMATPTLDSLISEPILTSITQ